MHPSRWLLAVVLLAPPLRAQAPDSTSIDAQLRELRQRVAQLERARGTAAPAVPADVGASPKGFFIRSRDGAFQIRLRGQVQTDLRMIDGAPRSATTFLVRSARPILDATAYRILDVRLVPDFGQGAATLQDAQLDVRIRPAFGVRVGKFKPPLGLERLQSKTDVVFVERGLASALAPQRDVGVQAGGDVDAGTLVWTLGVFNGAADLATADLDNGSQKDVDARVFALPFRTTAGALKALGAGIAFSSGRQYGTATSTGLPAYKSPSQQTVFAYHNDGTSAGSTLSNGTRARVNPEAYWYVGPFGAMADYMVEHQDVRRGTTLASLTHSAWQLNANFVLTGEAATFRSIVPAHPVGMGGRGAFEIGARVGKLRLDDATFPIFADPVQTRRVNNVGLVFTWYLAQAIKLSTELDRTTLSRATGVDDTERGVLTRFQLAF